MLKRVNSDAAGYLLYFTYLLSFARLSTTAVDRRSTPSLGDPGRTDKNLCRCFGAPACRVFPDHLIFASIQQLTRK